MVREIKEIILYLILGTIALLYYFKDSIVWQSL